MVAGVHGVEPTLPLETGFQLIVKPVAVALTVTTLVALVEPQLFVTVYEINALPAATPVTTPVLLTVAIEVLPLLQVPSVVTSLSVVVLPMFTDAVPVIAATTGTLFTVTDAVVAVKVPHEPDTVSV